MSTFTGFTDRAVDFYAELEADNSREFWTAHKATYESEVRDPMRALVAELEPDFGTGKVFRPYQDMRFSRDRPPYKLTQGATVGDALGVGYYVQVSADGLLVGGGFRAHGSDQITRYRESVDDETTGSALADIVDVLRTGGFRLDGEQLKTRPRGYDADHPRLGLIRHKSLIAVKEYGTPDWLSSRRTLDEVRLAWRALTPLSSWVSTYVGPATT